MEFDWQGQARQVAGSQKPFFELLDGFGKGESLDQLDLLWDGEPLSVARVQTALADSDGPLLLELDWSRGKGGKIDLLGMVQGSQEGFDLWVMPSAQTKISARRRELARKLGDLFDETNDLRTANQKMVDVLGGIMEADRIWLCRRRHGKQELQFLAHASHSLDALEPDAAVVRADLQKVLEGLQFEANQVQLLQEKSPGRGDTEQAALLVGSLKHRGHHQWILVMERRKDRGAWSNDDVEVMTDVSDLLVLTLENETLNARALERANYLSNVLDSSDLGIVVVHNLEGHWVVSLVNDRFCKFFGVDRDQVEGRMYEEVVGLVSGNYRNWNAHAAALEKIFADPTAEAVDEVILEQPVQRVLSRYTTPAKDLNGKIFGRMFFYRDISYDKEVEQQLLHSQKMESIGTLAGGVAHDFNNILTTLLGYTDLLKRELEVDSSAYAKLLQVEKSANRAAELTGNLLAFSRRNAALLKVFDVNRLVAETTKMLRSSLPASLEIRTELCEEAIPVEADETLVQQVLVNLMLNARDAIPEHRGTLVVTTRRGQDEQGEPSRQGIDYAILEVEDDGVGIPKEGLSRIFEPFYTTKEVGKGTGLGLSMVYGIIKQHDGFIEVTSAPGMGSKFSVYLPISEKPVGSTPEGGMAESIPDKEQVAVMVVDDEKDLRMFCESALGEICDRVLGADDGQEAVEIFEKDPLAIDLVILDLSMPRMNGGECLKRLKAMRPDVKVIISSGYNLDRTASDDLKEQADGFLPKPYTIAELSSAVREVLKTNPSEKAIHRASGE